MHTAELKISTGKRTQFVPITRQVSDLVSANG